MTNRIPRAPGTILAPCRTRTCDFTLEFAVAFYTVLAYALPLHS